MKASAVEFFDNGDSGPVRADRFVVALLLVLAGFQVFAVQRLEPWGSDASAYMTLADNLAAGAGYTLNFQPHTVYPPGFPALLAAAKIVIGDAGYAEYIRLMPLFGALGSILWYFCFREFAAPWAAAAAVLLVATSPAYFRLMTHNVLSEPAYFAASGAALWGVLLVSRSRGRGSRALLGIAVVAATVATVLIRSAGISLIAALVAWAAWAAWGLRFRTARGLRAAALAALAAAAAGMLVYGAWNRWTERNQQARYEGDRFNTYRGQFRLIDPHRPELGEVSGTQLAFRAANKLPVETSHLTAIALRLGWIVPSYSSPLVAGMLALLGWGVAVCLRDAGGALAAIYFAAYLGLFSLWPFAEGQRFMLPVAPVAALLVLAALASAAGAAARRPERLAGGLLALGAVAAAWFAFAVAAGPVSLQERGNAAIWFAVAAVGLGGAAAARQASPERLRIWCGRAPGIVARVARGATVALAVAGLIMQARVASANLRPDASTFRHRPTADAATWLLGADDGAVMAQQLNILHRLTGRRIVAFPITDDAEAILSAAEFRSARFLVVNDPVDYEYYFPTEVERWEAVERAFPGLLRLVHRGPGFRIFEFERPPETGAAR